MTSKKPVKSLGDILSKYDVDRTNYISREFQDYGYRLALSLDDEKSKSLYIKLAKEMPRAWLETAKNFVADADNVKSKARLFMWKLQQIKNEKRTSKK